MSRQEDRPETASGGPHRVARIIDAVAYAAIALLRSSDVETDIPDVLRMLGESADVSRIYVYQNTTLDGELADIQRFEWVAPGIERTLDARNLSHKYLPDYERYVRVLGTGGIIAELTDDAPESERAWLEREDVLSSAFVPIFVRDAWWGYIGFDDCWTARVWATEELSALRVAAETIGAALERQELDASLTEIERRYRTFIEQAPDLIIYADHPEQDSVTTYVSPQILDILGVTPEQWISAEGNSLWLAMLHPDDRERAERQYEDYLKGGPDLDDYRMVRPDGRIVWIRDRAKLVPGPDGKPVEWGVMLDVTDRRGMEDRLREAEARYRALVEQLPAVAYTEDAHDHVIYMSPRSQDILGVSADRWSEDPHVWSKLLVPEDRERAIGNSIDHADVGQRYLDEYRLQRPDGTIVWIRDEAVPIFDDEGNFLHWQGLMIDVSDQKRAQEQVREAEAKFQVLVEEIPAITFIDAITGDEGPRYISPQVESLLGYTPEEWTSEPRAWERVIHADDRARVTSIFEQADETLDPYVCDYRAIARDGRTVWLHEEAHVVRNTEGEPLYWLGAILDITSRKETEELERALSVEKAATAKLRALDELKDQFLAGVSHDLRTPLSSILGFTLTLERTYTDLSDEERLEFVNRITINARKLKALVDDLLDVHRLNQGAHFLRRSRVDAGALVTELVAQAHFLEDHPVTVEAESVIVRADETKVTRMVENLLINTARHTPTGTPVWVRVSTAPDGALITVEDAGPGIRADEKDGLFDEFTIGAGSRDSGSPGLGVGLSLVARFAELHGGRTWVEDREGGGSRFLIFLPAGPPD